MMSREPLQISSEWISFHLAWKTLELSQDRAEPGLWQAVSVNYSTQSDSDENLTPSPALEEL